MRLILIGGMVLAHACGGVASGADAGGGEADGDINIDSGVDGAVILGPFGAPTLVAELSSASVDDDPSLTADMLEIYFVSDRGGVGDIYRSQRFDVGDLWDVPQPVGELNSAAIEGLPQIRPDGLTIFFASRRGANGDQDIYGSTRPSRSSAWAAPTPVAELNTAANEDPNCLLSVDHMVMQRHVGSPIHFDLFETTRSNGLWSTPIPIASVNTSGTERAGCLADGGLELYYTAPGSQDLDLFVAVRPTLDADFGVPVELTELNDAGRDENPWVSADRRQVFFGSERGAARSIYAASR